MHSCKIHQKKAASMLFKTAFNTYLNLFMYESSFIKPFAILLLLIQSDKIRDEVRRGNVLA